MKRNNIKKVTRDKKFIGAVIGAVTSIATSVISAKKKKKAEALAQAAQTEQDGLNQAASMSATYADQQYVDEYKNKITLKNGGKMKNTNDRISKTKAFSHTGRKKAKLGKDGIADIANGVGQVGTLAVNALQKPTAPITTNAFNTTPKIGLTPNSYELDANGVPVVTDINNNVVTKYDDRMNTYRYGGRNRKKSK